MPDKPNPGSAEAVDLGCECAIAGAALEAKDE